MLNHFFFEVFKGLEKMKCACSNPLNSIIWRVTEEETLEPSFKEISWRDFGFIFFKKPQLE